MNIHEYTWMWIFLEFVEHVATVEHHFYIINYITVMLLINPGVYYYYFLKYIWNPITQQFANKYLCFHLRNLPHHLHFLTSKCLTQMSGFRPLPIFWSTLDISSELENSERGDPGLLFKWSKKFLGQKFENLFNFENRVKSGENRAKSANNSWSYGHCQKIFYIHTNYSGLHHPTKF